MLTFLIVIIAQFYHSYSWNFIAFLRYSICMYPCTVVVLILPLKKTAWLLLKRLVIVLSSVKD